MQAVQNGGSPNGGRYYPRWGEQAKRFTGSGILQKGNPEQGKPEKLRPGVWYVKGGIYGTAIFHEIRSCILERRIARRFGLRK